ncbi:protein of unknown function [Amycolatopsis arida]|uniref:DUF4281 domain-containing protein n=1 Tax=Amycolatopsis arida TaxID=587909 RepID=A0A1I5WQR7_9PSEU|nr:uncharacterized protein DUF4281 [Amycolatopsis arida]SFQ22145.1 protein of unknown function [Amycolatopsis arida]
MSTTQLFTITFYLVVPFWALMILAPRWSVTVRIIASPWIAAPPLVCYAILLVPHLGELWAVMSRPDLETLREFLGSPIGAAGLWAHLVGYDLLVGRWMYADSRVRGVHPLAMAPILLVTILLSPFGLLAYLLVRSAHPGAPTTGTPSSPPAPEAEPSPPAPEAEPSPPVPEAATSPPAASGDRRP